MPLLGSLAAGSVKGFGAQANLGYFLGQSLRFRESASAYLERTPVTLGNKQTWTWSGWVKRGNVAASSYYCLFGVDGVTPNNRTEISFSSNAIYIYEEVSSATIALTTTGLFRDPSAWYHIVVAIDTTQATSSDRVKLYVNGEQITSFSSATYPSLNYNTFVNSTNTHVIGARRYAGGTVNKYFDGYMGDVYLIDGQALTPSYFGKTDPSTGSWIPKKYSGTYGTNGFKLDFKHQSSASGFNTVLYEGNNGTQSIDNVGFSPDLVWIKQRTDAASHVWFDTIRGVGKSLKSNSSDAQESNSIYGYLSAFNSDGFTVTTGSTNAGRVNETADDYVAWCWDAGSSTVENTDGSITSNVRANPDYGFSIVKYVGTGATATVGHGLNSAPKMIIQKHYDIVDGWFTYHVSLGYEEYLNLWTTAASGTSLANYWGTAEPTSSVFGIGTWGGNNTSGGNHLAYCFAEVSGYSKISSYTGTGVSGNSITGLGFKPAFVLLKNASSTDDWAIHDGTRDPDNIADKRLRPNLSNVESTTQEITLDSDGFTVNSTATSHNDNGDTYIYMAFADTRDTAFWKDKSGTDNHWSLNAINYAASAETTYDLMNDVPTLTSEDKSNFATINPLDTVNMTVTEANLKATATADWYGWRATQNLPSTGKYYWEIYVNRNSTVNVQDQGYGLIGDSVNMQSQHPSQKSPTVFYTGSGSIYVNNSETQTAPTAFSVGDTVGIAVDMDAGTVQFYLNNSAQGTAESLPSNTGYWLPGSYQATNRWCVANFGQRPFAYTPPTGYKKLNTYNL